MLSQLNILSTSSVKLYYAENINNLPLTCHGTLMFCKVTYQHQYFIASKTVVLNFTLVRYSLHKCSETTLHQK